MGSFLLLLPYTWAVQLTEKYSIWVSPSSAGSGSSRSSSVSSGVFIAVEVDGVRDKGLGATTVVDVQTLLEAFLSMSLRSASFTDEVFFWQKAKLLVLGLLSSSAGLGGCPNYWMSD
jgi:hypothetical protein